MVDDFGLCSVSRNHLFISFAKEVCFCLWWFVCQQDNSKKLLTKFEEFLVGLDVVTNNIPFDFGDLLDHDSDSGIFCHCGLGAIL